MFGFFVQAIVTGKVNHEAVRPSAIALTAGKPSTWSGTVAGVFLAVQYSTLTAPGG